MEFVMLDKIENGRHEEEGIGLNLSRYLALKIGECGKESPFFP
jgi:hypothetical protein